MIEPRFYTIEQASEACNVSKDVLTAAIHKGTLAAKRSGKGGGGKYLIHPAALDDWFEGLVDA